jgi:hypothetical protein
MLKRVVFPWQTSTGANCHVLFGDDSGMTKTAAKKPFADWATGDQLRAFLKTITKEDRKKYLYVLVNALGAGEYFDSNINADYFPWNSLAHEGDDYGYKTFLSAHVFTHHANKEKEKAIGVPVLSLLNHPMKRVELVLRLDRAKAEQEGQGGLLTRIEQGDMPDVSMGCKVPWDICSICGNKAKARDAYCRCMRPPPELRGILGPNRILPDGRRIYVINIYPRFFDISFVFIGADKTAKTMAKLAAKGRQLCFGNVCAVPSYEDRRIVTPYEVIGDVGQEKLACALPTYTEEGLCGPCGQLCNDCPKKDACHTEKIDQALGIKTAAQKIGAIVKSVPSGVFAMKKLPSLEQSEPDIDKSTLDHLAKERLSECCGGIGALGMILKPREFQRIVLVRMGEGGLADDLDARRLVFRQVKGFDDSLEPAITALALQRIISLLGDLVAQRTALGPRFRLRIILGKKADNSLPTRQHGPDALLDKVSAAYNGYRRAALSQLAQVVEAVSGDSKLREVVLGENLSDVLEKTASGPILSLDSVAYVMSAHLADRSLLLSTAVASAATNPWLLDGEGHFAA